jgi:diguanylate cyclase (GGDEF)-like protein/PAS domain S-box-containing protein
MGCEPTPTEPPPDDVVDYAVLRRLPDLIGRVNGCRSLSDTLQAVVDGVVDVVGFDVAAISYVHVDNTFEVLAVAGDAAARAHLLGQRLPADAFDEEFSVADRWGSLRFVPHERFPDVRREDWVPEFEPLDLPDAWHPLDALFAPLCSPAGDLVGMLSVDLPRDRRMPSTLQREILEMFAAQAGIAIDNARLREQLQTSEEAFRLAFEGAGIGMALVSFSSADHGRYVRVNAAFCRIVGRSEEELLKLRFVDITHADDRARDIAFLERAAAGGPKVNVIEKRYIHGDGRTVWAAVTASIVSDAEGGDHYLIVQIEDIGDRRAAHEELRRRAGHDDLTGLFNRHILERRLESAVEAARGGGRAGALLFCDLDGFKAVNDTYGHDTGDRALAAVAQRLADASRRGDTVARMGGDEFVVLARNITASVAAQLAERLKQAVAAPIAVDQVLVHVTLSVGIAYLDQHPDAAAVLRAADADMYRTKRSARGDDSPAATPPPDTGAVGGTPAQ